MTTLAESPVVFQCRGESLLGILHRPARASATGVLVVVGGPQYRLGSHRQFVLLARYLAAHGIAVFRFDYRGMGDSSGALAGFEGIGPDIAAAIDAFAGANPGLARVILWGLCDAASAALFHAHKDPRVAGLVLLNPWVRTEQGLARTYLKHYYFKRLVSRDFWAKIGSGGWEAKKSIGSLISMVAKLGGGVNSGGGESGKEATVAADLPSRMAEGLERFAGPVLFILSHNDYVADEFREMVAQSKRWQRLMKAARVTIQELDGANHTFSRREWRDTVAAWTRAWIESRFAGSADA